MDVLAEVFEEVGDGFEDFETVVGGDGAELECERVFEGEGEVLNPGKEWFAGVGWNGEVQRSVAVEDAQALAEGGDEGGGVGFFEGVSAEFAVTQGEPELGLVDGFVERVGGEGIVEAVDAVEADENVEDFLDFIEEAEEFFKGMASKQLIVFAVMDAFFDAASVENRWV